MEERLLALRRAATAELLRLGVPFVPADRGYLIAVRATADDALRRHGAITIPLSVFGGSAAGWSVASALPVVEKA